MLIEWVEKYSLQHVFVMDYLDVVHFGSGTDSHYCKLCAKIATPEIQIFDSKSRLCVRRQKLKKNHTSVFDRNQWEYLSEYVYLWINKCFEL